MIGTISAPNAPNIMSGADSYDCAAQVCYVEIRSLKMFSNVVGLKVLVDSNKCLVAPNSTYRAGLCDCAAQVRCEEAAHTASSNQMSPFQQPIRELLAPPLFSSPVPTRYKCI